MPPWQACTYQLPVIRACCNQVPVILPSTSRADLMPANSQAPPGQTGTPVASRETPHWPHKVFPKLRGLNANRTNSRKISLLSQSRTIQGKYARQLHCMAITSCGLVVFLFEQSAPSMFPLTIALILIFHAQHTKNCLESCRGCCGVWRAVQYPLSNNRNGMQASPFTMPAEQSKPSVVLK